MRIILRTIARDLFLVMIMLRVSSALALEYVNPGPVRIWGELSSTYRVRESGESDNKFSSWLNTGTISASSYVWRPWFATANGDLSLSVDDTDSEDQPKSTEEFATGNVEFNLFPGSRFPFRAYYIESRDQFDTEAFEREVATTEFGVRQLYSSPDGIHNYRLEYENNLQDNNDANDFASESLILAGSNRVGRHDIDTDINLDTVDNTTLNEGARSYSITLDHSYDDATNFSIDNLVSRSTIENDLFDSNNDVETAQLSSFLSWNPQNRKYLRLTGSLRLSETETIQQPADITLFEPVENEFATANLNQGLIYEYSNNLQFGESINVNAVENAGEVTSIFTESVSARYLADRSETALGDYGWSAGTSYSNRHGDVESEQSLGSQFSQSLLNDYSVQGGYQLRTSLTQSLNYDYKSVREDEKSIDHSYSLTWSDASIGNQNLIRLFISDSRALNRDDDFFQLINLQYSGSMRFSRYAQLSGNATLQRSNQEFERRRSETTTRNGQLAYQHNRAFRVPGLLFLSELELSKRQTEAERLIEDPDSDTEVSLENSLRYRIGRLDAELDLDFIKVGDEYDRLFRLKLTRSFGDL